jgi:hypothetical protein
MPVSDFDIQYSAHLYIQLHGDAASAKARAKVEQMRAKADSEGADNLAPQDRRHYHVGPVADQGAALD